jgi:hypothetical protein
LSLILTMETPGNTADESAIVETRGSRDEVQ